MAPALVVRQAHHEGYVGLSGGSLATVEVVVDQLRHLVGNAGEAGEVDIRLKVAALSRWRNKSVAPGPGEC